MDVHRHDSGLGCVRRETSDACTHVSMRNEFMLLDAGDTQVCIYLLQLHPSHRTVLRGLGGFLFGIECILRSINEHFFSFFCSLYLRLA